jgi:hypothetical protein
MVAAHRSFSLSFRKQWPRSRRVIFWVLQALTVVAFVLLLLLGRGIDEFLDYRMLLLLCSLAIFIMMTQHFALRVWAETVLRHWGECALSWDESGLISRTSGLDTHCDWKCVTEIYGEKTWVTIVLGGAGLYIPDSAFTPELTREAFLAQIRGFIEKAYASADLPEATPSDRACARSDSSPRDSVPSDPKPIKAPEQFAEITSAFARRRAASLAFVGQLWRVLTFRRPDPSAFRATPLALLLPILLFFLLLLIPEIVRDGWPGEMEWSNASGILLAFAFMALAVGFLIMVSGSRTWDDGGRVLLALNWLLLLSPLVVFLIVFLGRSQPFAKFHWHGFVLTFVVLALLLRQATPTERSPYHALECLLSIFVVSFAFYLAWTAAFSYETRNLWTSSAEKARWAARRESRPPRLNLDEDTLFTQPRLLDESIAAVAPGTPGHPEIFFLGVAGYTQQVFLNEIRMAQTLFVERFGAQGRTLLLANNVKTAKEIPFAHRETLRRALSGIARRMNPEDTLFLFMSSHGSRESGFSLVLRPLNLTDISPEMLRELLDASGIKRRVVVVSGCYSGQFIPALQNDDSLVITASSADRTSFGCGDDSEFTDFGRAYFIEALNETRSFTEAFRLAAERIATREKEEERTPSLPQIARGKNYRDVAEDGK